TSTTSTSSEAMRASASWGLIIRAMTRSCPGAADLSRLKAVKRRHERVDVVVRVVGREGRAHGRFDAETPEDGLRAVVPRPDGSAVLIEDAADLFRLLSREDERHHRRLPGRGADHREPRHTEEARSSVLEQLVLVDADVLDADVA